MLVRLTRGVVKVQLGDQGARAGLVFLFDHDPSEEGQKSIAVVEETRHLW